MLAGCLLGPQAQAAVGRTAGTFAVSPTGAATYQIPIWAPPGPQGLQPNISLAYSSQAGNGPEGVGWSIAGLSSIYRCNSTVAQDSAAAAITLTYADHFCMDGQRLRLTSSETLSTYGQDGTTYQTEIANFSNVIAHGTAGNGPAYFTVQAKNGWTYEYGHTIDSQLLGTGATSFGWMLDKITDRAGNTMQITWRTADANLAGMTVPSRIAWTPSSHGSTAYNYTMSFNYQILPLAVRTGYLAGQQVQNFYSLASIQIQSSGTTTKDYFLGYTASTTTGRQTLTSIAECADTLKTNCLYSTQLTYQTSQPGVSTTPITAETFSTSTPGIERYDFNGDGLADLVWRSGGSLYVALATGTGYGTPINTGITSTGVVYGHLLPGTADGILVNSGNVWWFYSWNGSGFSGQTTGLTVDCSFCALADVDGDGLDDLVGLNTDGWIHTRLNTGSASSLSFSMTSTQAYHWGSVPITGINRIPHSTSGSRRSHNFDFNGDGRADAMLNYIDIATHTTYSVVLISQGSTQAGITFASNGNNYADVLGALDWNDDGCADLVMSNVVAISACNSAVATSIPLPATAVGLIDWDGDGRTDVLVNNGGTLGVYLSTGTRFSNLIATTIPYSSNATYGSTDMDGDGQDDLITHNVLAAPFTLQFQRHNSPGQIPDLLTNVTDGYGNSASPTYVSIAQGDYTKGSGVKAGYENYIGPMYVVNKVTFSDPGQAGATYYQTYAYTDGWRSLEGRGFTAFQVVQQYDSRNSLWESFGYDYYFPYIGNPVFDELAFDQANAQPIRSSYASNEQSITLDGTANNQRYFVYNNLTTQQYQVSWSPTSGSTAGPLIETDTTTFTNWDNYGNAGTLTTTRTDKDSNSPYNGASWTTTTTHALDVDTAHWCLGLFTQTQVAYTDSLSINDSVTRTQQFTPDTINCRYNTIITEPNSASYKVTESLGYDSFGNVNSDTVTGIGMTPRQTLINWTDMNSTTGQLPMNVTDAAGAQTQLNYDFRYGLRSNLNDANNVATSWQYDAFARPMKESHADHTALTWSYTDCHLNNYCPGTSKLEITATQVDTGGNYLSDVQTYPDALDRPIETYTRNQNAGSGGNSYTFSGWQYDALGRQTGFGLPVLAGGNNTVHPFVTYSYDALNRRTQEQRPISSTNSSLQTTSYQYQGRSTKITDANGRAKTLIQDVNGWLRTTTDASNYVITLGYDAAGSRTSVTDNLGNPLWSTPTPAYAYGLQPMLLGFTDADLGPWSAGYDALGERTSWTDAKGQHFSAKFDALSRMTDRYELDLYTHWTWGTSATVHEIGQLNSVCTGTGTNPTACTSATGYAESETYDGFGRPLQRAIQIPGDATYTYTKAYNATTGFLDTLTYPTGAGGYALKVQYGYSNGLLSSITDVSDSPNIALWTGNAVDGRSHFTQETLGNGVIVNHSFDGVTGWLSKITAGRGGGAALQNNSYLFDEVGNLTQRQDNNAGVTENVYPDAQNRLDHTVGDSSTVMAYDSMGRLSQWGAGGVLSNTNDYTTPQSGCSYYSNAQPHAVRKDIGGTHYSIFCYDANGNMSSRTDNYTVGDTQSLIWMSYNQPNKISGTIFNGSSQFFYDHNHQRWKQIASYNGSSETTEYIGGLLEQMTNSSGTVYRFYVPAGNNFIVYTRPNTGSNANTPYYITQDHLGSSAVITDKGGTSLVKETFAALGWNENSSTDQTTIANVTRHEFTGHEELDNIGFVNMNGRLYNPSGSHFLSPDPTQIQDPTNTISYNRYAYANYNPLTYVDPSGFDACFQTSIPVNYNVIGDDGVPAVGFYYASGPDFCVPDLPPLSPPTLQPIGSPGLTMANLVPPSIRFPLQQQENQCSDGDSGGAENGAEAAGNAATAGAAVADSNASLVDQAAAASLRVGRPAAATTAILDPALLPGWVQWNNVYVWRAGQAANGLVLAAGAQVLGAAGTIIDGFSAAENFKAGDVGQGALDTVSTASGASMLLSFEVAGPVAIPFLAAAKLEPVQQRMAVRQHCMGVPWSSMINHPF